MIYLYVIAGQARYAYGATRITLETGDSLSLDAELSHGFTEVITPEFVYLTVQAERRR